ncbi:ABC transporter [Brachyspira hyodysenteriae]|uniref:ABC-type transport system protein involved in gliding motility auxiliary component-like protein n=1 Tax=Brachyspira hyodysenteriae (strain ATCC 49526 / WA1) TaxID=565034 RepID=A0A3B6V8N8_BRAHW|nr:Gldg family protein [Brachyspira hyodysenteriae]ACN83442.1 putative ABC-type transport system protein involved in gliding motility auxiliary component-like protein [Brachyspira hyodysenteriae WA1]KLI41859.1 ABC transporter [Brachyspira hyodysenteriae]KLI54012.1 ABC transporter [Brachyspira hyodysenteriae]
MTKKKDRIITFSLIVIIIILINAIANQFTPMIDLTKDKVYSLSKESKNLVKNLKEPMSVKFFVTPNLPPPFSTYEKYIKDLFEGYKAAGGKNISFEVIDASKHGDLASQYRINPTQISVLEKDQTQTKVAYMGLSFIYGDSIETIPFVQSTEGLEYNIDTIIRKMMDKNDRLARLENNLNVYYVSSKEIYDLLPIGAMELIPDSIMQAVADANKDLMNKVRFINVDMSNHTAENEELLKKLNVKKIEWDDIKDPNGNIVANKGSAYFSLILENGDDIRQLSTSYILYGAFDEIKNEISKNIDSMLGLKATIGYVQGHEEANYITIPPQFGGNPNDAYDSVSQYVTEIQGNYNFEAVDIALNDIPSSIDALIIAGSKTAFSDYELYKLDQFIMSGKPVLFMLNGVQINQDDPNAQMYGPKLIPVTNRLNEILTNYGFTVAENMIFDDNAYKAQLQQGMPEQKMYYIPLIASENINAKNDITKSINILLTPISSEIITNINNTDIKVTPLIYTSDKSWVETENFTSSMTGMPTDADKLSKRLLAASFEGKMNSAFTGKDIPSSTNAQNNINSSINRINSTTSGRVIVVGSYEMAKNSAYEANKIFLMNLVDYMAGDSGLMSIRRKGAVFNPPYQVPETVKLFVRVINIVMLPIAVIVFGLMLWSSDKKRRQNIFEKFNSKAE